MQAATFFDGEGLRDGILDDRMLLRDERPPADLPRLDGVIVGGFTDHHVHLQLVDSSLLAHSTLGRVIDLGGNPSVLRALAADARSGAKSTSAPFREVENASESPFSDAFSTSHAGGSCRIEFAGAFLTASGGYPSDRDWAPAGSWREIATISDAEAVITEMADAGASVIKVACNSTAGPVFGDETLRTIVVLAAGRGLPVVAHAEGDGEAQRAARLGVRMLAHAPFTERLTDDEIAAQAASVSWISTLAIHDGADRVRALDNVRRFHAAGGTVLYGTDMGNGPTPVGLNPAEVAALREAGIDGVDLLRALAPQDPLDPASTLLRLTQKTLDPLDARPLKV
ncbi:amidohydrolase family protein [Microbacterium aurantiacum]|uniref:amidohydrolase family protein n=1 Tax=Microbacterium aurantiacum TaxID=162393 RepID=UPI000C801A30|nr:hydrolase [Microbacterium aurantiacum]